MRLAAGQVAVVTGAARGIGRALCAALAGRGCDLALVDRDEAGLAETRALVESAGRRASTHLADVGRRAEVETLPEAVLESHGRLDLLVNNAGVSLAGPLERLSPDDLEWIVGANLWGVVYGCRFFLPHLRRAREAHIVNMLSSFALIGFPTKSAYCATKFGARGFSEALRVELHGSAVGLTCVYPGPADTGLVREGRAWDDAKQKVEARFLRDRGIPLERIAARTLQGIERNAARVFIGPETYAVDLMTRVCPVLAGRLLARFQGRFGFV